jgi:fumarate hydratase subunit beta
MSETISASSAVYSQKGESVTGISAPADKLRLATLKAGDSVLISGTIYSARDAAHKRLIAAVEAGAALPFDIKNALIYHMGPSPAPPGSAIGSAGPTTSGRMNPYSPILIKMGLGAIIGKGRLSEETRIALAENGSVYFAAVGGAGALLSQSIKSAEVIAWPEVGAEAVMRLVVRDFPAIVAIDAEGRDLYKTGPEAYLSGIGVER